MTARCVPRQLTPKWSSYEWLCALLHLYEAEGDDFLHCIVIGHESWVHYFQPGTNQASKEWQHSTSYQNRTNFMQLWSQGITHFKDHNGIIMEHYILRLSTVNSGCIVISSKPFKSWSKVQMLWFTEFRCTV